MYLAPVSQKGSIDYPVSGFFPRTQSLQEPAQSQ